MCSQQKVAAAVGFAGRVHVYGLMLDYAVFAQRQCAVGYLQVSMRVCACSVG